MTNQVNEAAYNLYSQELEEQALGACLISPLVFDQLTNGSRPLDPDDFYFLKHNYIFAAMLYCKQTHGAVDNVTVGHRLGELKQLESVGGAAFLTHLMGNTGSSIHGVVYGGMVQRIADRRRMLDMADRIKVIAVDETVPVTDAIDRIENVMLDVGNLRKSDAPSLTKSVNKVMNELESFWEGNEDDLRLPTGIDGIDRITGGLFPHELTIIGARPGMGKTSLLLQIINNLYELVESGKVDRRELRVAYWSGEMSSEQVIKRMMSQLSKSSIGQMRNRATGGNGLGSKLYSVASWISELEGQLIIDDTAGLTVQEWESKCRAWHFERPIDLIFVDYLQLMKSNRNYTGNNAAYLTASDVSATLKEMSGRFNVPVIAAAQLNREVDKRADKRPQLSDLRDSGRIEQDADVVGYLYRDVVYNKATETPDGAELIFRKMRNGQTGTAHMIFHEQSTSFRDAQVRRVDMG